MTDTKVNKEEYRGQLITWYEARRWAPGSRDTRTTGIWLTVTYETGRSVEFIRDGKPNDIKEYVQEARLSIDSNIDRCLSGAVPTHKDVQRMMIEDWRRSYGDE